MNINELIVSGMLESYVLGTTSDEENALLHDLCKTHPELLKEIETIEKSLIRFSERSANALDPALKQKIMAGIAFKETELPASPAKIIPLPKPESDEKLKIYKFAVAASILLFLTSFVYNILLQKQLSRANGELAELNASKSVMADQLNIQQASMKHMSDQFNIVANPKVKTIALNGMNYLIKSSAAVHWNTETDEVYFDATQLPASPAAKQYQLWAIVAGKPVDAGMIDPADSKGIFQKMKSIKGAQAFAVTIERVGGSATPTLETMCLLGNV